MLRWVIVLLAAGVVSSAASAQPLVMQPAPYPGARMVVMPQPRSPERLDLGGGFVEFLFGDRQQGPLVSVPLPTDREQRPVYVNTDPRGGGTFDIDPRYLRQEVDFDGKQEPGTVVIDTPNKFLYFVMPNGRAVRYGIGVGRPGFTWAGVHTISAKREWPDWRPPDEMIKRQPGLPHFMAGGPGNPLGARALYLGSTLYRIHGTAEPWTIGQNVSSGCIRLRNGDVVDLYSRVGVGTKVVVM